MSNLSLTWDSHSDTLLNNLHVLYIQKSFCDATIICNGKHIGVHRVVLSSCSKYFEEIFEKISCSHPYIVINEMTLEDLETLLAFIYKGLIVIREEKLNSFFKTVSLFKVKGFDVPADFVNPSKVVEPCQEVNFDNANRAPTKKRTIAQTKEIISNTDCTLSEMKNICLDEPSKPAAKKISKREINQDEENWEDLGPKSFYGFTQKNVPFKNKPVKKKHKNSSKHKASTPVTASSNAYNYNNVPTGRSPHVKPESKPSPKPELRPSPQFSITDKECARLCMEIKYFKAESPTGNKMSRTDLRHVIKNILDRSDTTISTFKNNFPSREWVDWFLDQYPEII